MGTSGGTLPVSKLAEPGEGLSIFHLLFDHLLHYISCMDINGADSADALAVCLSQVPQQQVDEGVELGHLQNDSQVGRETNTNVDPQTFMGLHD